MKVLDHTEEANLPIARDWFRIVTSAMERTEELHSLEDGPSDLLDIVALLHSTSWVRAGTEVVAQQPSAALGALSSPRYCTPSVFF